MTGLPVVERELRMAARNPRTYAYRSQIALIGIAVTATLLTPIIFGWRLPSQGGRTLFFSLSTLALAGSWLCGLFITADAISSERRTGTLGLLFLTPLRSYEILLGKLAAKSITTVFGLVVLVPFLALTLLIGGVSLAEFGRMCLVLFTGLFLSLTTGLFISSFTGESRNAFSATLLLLLVICVGPILDYVIQTTTVPAMAARPWYWPSPALSFLLTMDDYYPGSSNIFWKSLGYQWGLSIFWLVAGSFLIHWVALDPWTKSRTTTSNHFRPDRLSKHSLRHSSVEQSWMEFNPIYWMARREEKGWPTVWFVCCWLALVLLGVFLLYTKAFFYADTMVLMIFLVQTLAQLWMALEVTRNFHRTRQSGELELLLVTPLSVKQIVNGHLMCVRRPFLHVIALVMGFNAMMLMVAAISSRSVLDFDLILPWLVATGLFLVNSLAMIWTGLWQGMKAATMTRSFLKTMFLIIILPWIYMAVLGPALATLIQGRIDEAIWLGCWLSVGYLNAFTWLGISMGHCYDDFRTEASGW